MNNDPVVRSSCVMRRASCEPRIASRTTHDATRGFTLMELLLVVVIIGILAALVAPRFVGKSQETRVAAAKAQIEHYSTALVNYERENEAFPTSEQGLAALVDKPSTSPAPANWKGPYLMKREIALDPWMRSYVYRCPPQGETDTKQFELFSMGPDGREGTEDDVK